MRSALPIEQERIVLRELKDGIYIKRGKLPPMYFTPRNPLHELMVLAFNYRFCHQRDTIIQIGDEYGFRFVFSDILGCGNATDVNQRMGQALIDSGIVVENAFCYGSGKLKVDHRYRVYVYYWARSYRKCSIQRVECNYLNKNIAITKENDMYYNKSVAPFQDLLAKECYLTPSKAGFIRNSEIFRCVFKKDTWNRITEHFYRFLSAHREFRKHVVMFPFQRTGSCYFSLHQGHYCLTFTKREDQFTVITNSSGEGIRNEVQGKFCQFVRTYCPSGMTLHIHEDFVLEKGSFEFLNMNYTLGADKKTQLFVTSSCQEHINFYNALNDSESGMRCRLGTGIMKSGISYQDFNEIIVSRAISCRMKIPPVIYVSRISGSWHFPTADHGKRGRGMTRVQLENWEESLPPLL